ncbi:hypothetical protein [Radiobacillus deserti]|uniref:hypothetical protein n=1 Tax=Radiobacillus deserti TaxID=2594883 RepID=UPI00188D787A|nr:hypothetical protein [Radiobacillus deserti]
MSPNHDLEMERKNIEKKSDSSVVASTFIKYAAYVIITFAILWFLANYVVPMF